MKAIYNLDVPVDPKAPKPFSQTEEVPHGKNLRAKSGLRRKQSSKHTSKSKTKASKSKIGQSEKKLSPVRPRTKAPAILYLLHYFFHLHSESGSGYDASTDSTAKDDPRLSAPNDSIPSQQDQTKSARDGLKTAQNEDTSTPHPPSPKLAKIQELMAQVQLLQSQKDELEQQKAKAEAEVASLKARSSYPNINQLTNLLITSLKPELSKLLASHSFASCLPTELKELPSKFIELSREIKELKQHVKDMEIELPGDLKEIPTKLETFTSTISSLTSQVAELKNIQWELPAELQALPILVSLV
ncbi:hypothetical protein Tco_1299443 [Tanacetum coccineum]